MPTYDYICKHCGAELEFFQPITASAKRKCPECGELKLQRQIGAGAGIIFKGSGFYTTDYRSDSYKAGEKADRSGGSGKQGGSSSAADKGKSKGAAPSKKPAADGSSSSTGESSGTGAGDGGSKQD